MIDVKETVVQALRNVKLPVLYELFVDETIPIPCISYKEINNSHRLGNTDFNYSDIAFQVKIWDRNIENITKLSVILDRELSLIGLKRTYSTEISSKGIISKVFRYEGIGYEIN